MWSAGVHGIAVEHRGSLVLHVDPDPLTFNATRHEVANLPCRNIIVDGTVGALERSHGRVINTAYVLHPNSLGMIEDSAHILRPGGSIIVTIDSAGAFHRSVENVGESLNRGGISRFNIIDDVDFMEAFIPGFRDTTRMRVWNFDYGVWGIRGE